MANKLKNKKGFSLIELLIAIAIFTIVISSNFVLIANVYRGSANDRTKVEVGLSMKDMISGIYTFKNENWNSIKDLVENENTDSQKLELINNKFQLSPGETTEGKVTYNIYFGKAKRSWGEIVLDGEGTDPLTIKVTITASWKDVLGVSQQITEDYFFSNWASARWTEATDEEFSDGSPAPVYRLTKVLGDSVAIDSEQVIGNSDWCNLSEGTTIKNIDTGTDFSYKIATAKGDYSIVEPYETFPSPVSTPGTPELPDSDRLDLGNENSDICNAGTGIPIKECETLIKIYNSLGGTNWTDKTGWTAFDTRVLPTMNPPQPTYTPGSITAIIDSSTDDAFSSSISSISLDNENIWYKGGYYSGLKFNNITIPQGSTIDSATISWYVTNNTVTKIDADFYAEAVDNSSTFSTAADLRSRILTTASKTVFEDFGTYGRFTIGTNFSSIIQEVINRSGWTSGNSLSIIAIGNGEEIRVRSYDYGGTGNYRPAELIIDYTVTTYGEASGGICSLFGITCNNGHITKLNLSGNNLVGKIPREIGNLEYLEELVLDDNSEIDGVIPPEIGYLSALTKLNLGGSSLSGYLPTTIGRLTNLTELQLSNTSLTGKLPVSIGKLTNLSKLNLSNSKFVCHLPAEVTLLSSLSEVNLSGNYFVNSKFSEINNKLSLNGDEFQSPPEALKNIITSECVLSSIGSKLGVLHTETDGSFPDELFTESSLTGGAFPPTNIHETIIDGMGETWKSNALKFDNSVVKIPFSTYYNLPEEGFTISFWMRPDSTNGSDNARVVTFRNGGTIVWTLSSGTGGNKSKYYFTYNGVNSISLALPTLTNNAWYHISVVGSEGEAKLYVNGALQTSDTYSELTRITTGDLLLGDSTEAVAPVTLDEFRIYNRSLPVKELVESRFSEVDRTDPGLIGYWRMDHPTGNYIYYQVVYDYSYLRNHGMLGTSFSDTIKDATSVDGITRYRINDIIYYKNKAYLATTDPNNQIIVYDKSKPEEERVSDIELVTPGDNNQDTRGLQIVDNKLYVLQDSKLVQISLGTDEILKSINVNPGDTGLSSPMSVGFKSNKVFLTSLDAFRNFMVLDISNGLDNYTVDKVQNILLNTYL